MTAAALYVRVSTSGQAEDGSSLQTQEERCRAYAAEHGYDVAGVYRETYSGAELWERPQLNALRAAVGHRGIDVIVAYAIDRLSRKPVHLLLLLEETERAGARIEFVTEQIDDSPEGKLIHHVRGYAAELEREKIRERSLRGKRARVQSGKVHNAGPEMYGYRRDKAAGVRVIYEPEAVVVRRIFRFIGDERGAIRELRRRLNAEGVVPPAASKRGAAAHAAGWAKATITRILHETAYKGEEYAWRRKRFTQNAKQWRDRSEWVPLPAEATPALVSPELWEAAQQAIAVNHGQATRNETRPYLLRGLISCAVCGRSMYSSPERDRRTYRCSSRDTVSGACGGKRVTADAAEKWAWERVSAILRDPSIVAAELERQRAGPPDPLLTGDCAALRRQLEKLERQQERLIQRFSQAEDDTFPWELVQREIARVEQEKAQVRAELAAAEQRIIQQAAAVEQLDALTTFCERVGQNLDRFGFADQRLALEALGITVQANGREWTLTGRIPLDPEAGVLTRTCS